MKYEKVTDLRDCFCWYNRDTGKPIRLTYADPISLAHELGHAIAATVYQDYSETSAWKIAKDMIKPELWDTKNLIKGLEKVNLDIKDIKTYIKNANKYWTLARRDHEYLPVFSFFGWLE